MFRDAGYICETVFLGESERKIREDASAVILPTPYEKNGFLNAPFSEAKIPIGGVLSSIPKNVLILGGGIPENEKNAVDISKREDFQRKNAIPTAEAAVLIAMQRSEKTLFGSNVSVLGYGRIGSYLAGLLASFGANVSVFARREESRVSAENSGARAFGFEDINSAFENADVIFNTVPSPIIGENDISALKSDAVFIDLASLPGGVTKDAEDALGARFERALALPGKYFPETAGRIIFETVSEILREKGVAE
jgi:dipicolinate synthase subunit A